jgi:hypothetical protein
MTKTTPEQNKVLVLEAFDTLFNKRDYAAAAPFWSENYIPELAIRIPIIREIVASLADEAGRSLPRCKLIDKLGAQSCQSDADRVFDHVVAWGPYAGLFSYDAATGQVSLSAGEPVIGAHSPRCPKMARLGRKQRPA